MAGTVRVAVAAAGRAGGGIEKSEVGKSCEASEEAGCYIFE